jgi:hypothetical protein
MIYKTPFNSYIKIEDITELFIGGYNSPYSAVVLFNNGKTSTINNGFKTVEEAQTWLDKFVLEVIK